MKLFMFAMLSRLFQSKRISIKNRTTRRTGPAPTRLDPGMVIRLSVANC